MILDDMKKTFSFPLGGASDLFKFLMTVNESTSG